LRDLKLCFDIGHANLESSVAASLEAMRDRIVTTHIHDNHGERDEHLLPYTGDIDWNAALGALGKVLEPLPLVLELKEQTYGKPALAEIRAVFDKLERNLQDTRADSARS